MVTGCFFLFEGQIRYRASVRLSSCFFYYTYTPQFTPPSNKIPGYAPGSGQCSLELGLLIKLFWHLYRVTGYRTWFDSAVLSIVVNILLNTETSHDIGGVDEWISACIITYCMFWAFSICNYFIYPQFGSVMWSETLVLLQDRSQTNRIRSWSSSWSCELDLADGMNGCALLIVSLFNISVQYFHCLLF